MTETTADISREQLKDKPVADWSEAEAQAAKQMTHTLGVSLYNARRLDDLAGSKTKSWDDILGTALDRLEGDDHE